MANGKLELYGMTPIRALSMTTHNELIALTTISSFQGQNETAFPGLDKLSERSGISKQAFSKAVTGLVKKNLVNRKRRYGSSNIYFVVWEFADKAEIKKENDAERRMSRAKILAKNIQSSESIGYIKESDHDYPNDSDVSYPNGSDDILKEQNKITELKEHTLTLSEQLKELAEKNGLTYSINTREQNLFQNKLSMEMGLTNDRILEQANRFFEIVKRDQKQTWIHSFSFGFKFLQFNWDKIDAWHNANKSNVVKFIQPTEKKAPAKFSDNDLDSLKEFLA